MRLPQGGDQKYEQVLVLESGKIGNEKNVIRLAERANRLFVRMVCIAICMVKIM